MTIQALPFPLDPFRPLREANVERARKIYGFALERAQQIAQTSQQADSRSVSQWSENLDTCLLTVQPVQPLQKLLSPRELQSRARALLNEPRGRFFDTQEAQIPQGLMFSRFFLPRQQRSVQILFDNGLVCHIGGIQIKPEGALPRLHLPSLIGHIADTLHVAHHLHASPAFKDDMSLLISVENLDAYSVDPLISGGFLHDYDLALVKNWTWEYLVPQETFADLPSLGSFAATVIEDVCWAFGDSRVNERTVSMLAQQLGLQLKS